MKFARILVPLAILAIPFAAHAQGIIPAAVTPGQMQTIDYLGWITHAIDQLVGTGGDLFVRDGLELARILAVILLICKAARWMLEGVFDFHLLVEFLIKFALVLALLYYYNHPFLGSNLNLRTIFTDTALQLSRNIKMDILNDFLAQVNAITNGMQRPGFMDMLGLMTYESVLMLMALVDIAMFAVTSFGFMATGVGGLLGPLFIPMLLVPALDRKFWQWVDFMIVYSFYRVVATAVLFVWTNVMMQFFDQVVGLDYSLGHLLGMITAMAMVMVAFAWSIFKVHAITVELFGGIGNLGSQFSAGLTRVVSAVFL